MYSAFQSLDESTKGTALKIPWAEHQIIGLSPRNKQYPKIDFLPVTKLA